MSEFVNMCPACGSTNVRKASMVNAETRAIFYCRCNDCGEFFQENFLLTHVGTIGITKNDIPRRSLDELFLPRLPEELPDVVETCYER